MFDVTKNLAALFNAVTREALEKNIELKWHFHDHEISQIHIQNLSVKLTFQHAEPNLVAIAFRNYQHTHSGSYAPCFISYATTNRSDLLGSPIAHLVIASRGKVLTPEELARSRAIGAAVYPVPGESSNVCVGSAWGWGGT